MLKNPINNKSQPSEVVILAGGLGSRIMEETVLKPKPMIEIGGRPILWHLMKIYSSQNINKFIICLGYKGHIIKEYFLNYLYYNSNFQINTLTSSVKNLDSVTSDNWTIDFVDTGYESMTANRLSMVSKYILNDTFFMTYGDGLAKINLKKLVNSHNKSKKIATLTAVKPPARFGHLELKGSDVIGFTEKKYNEGSNKNLINGGFFVLNKEIFKYIHKNKNEMWEEGPLERITKNGQLSAFVHKDFWQPVDTLRDKKYLESLWENKKAPWKTW